MLGRCRKPALTWGRQQEPLLLQDAESELWAERPELIGQQCHKALSEIWPTQHTVQWVVVEVLLYIHRNCRFIRDGSPGRPPQLSHGSRALSREREDAVFMPDLANTAHNAVRVKTLCLSQITIYFIHPSKKLKLSFELNTQQRTELHISQ